MEEKIIKDCIKNDWPIPKVIREAPQLYFGLGLYLRAFYDLENSRAVSTFEGYIPWVTIQQYCMLNGFDADQTEDTHFYINRMDSAYLKHRRPKSDGKT